MSTTREIEMDQFYSGDMENQQIKRLHKKHVGKKKRGRCFALIALFCIFALGGGGFVMWNLGFFDGEVPTEVLPQGFRGPLPTNGGSGNKVLLPLSSATSRRVLFVTETGPDDLEIERIRSYEGNAWYGAV